MTKKKETEIALNITGAIRHYNLSKKPVKKMTMESLGKKVFHDESVKESVSKVYLSQWNTGNLDKKKCEVKHLTRISEATGFDLCELIIIN